MKSDFIIALTQLAAERNLPREIVLSAIEAALVSAYKRDSVAAGQDISVKLDPASGDVSVYIVKTATEEVTDPQLEMSLADARKIKPDAEIGEVIPTEELPHSAGRIAAQTAKQVVIQRLREAERELVFQEYADKEGEVFTVTVQRMEPKQLIVELGRAEAILPQSEQAPYERYRVGQKLRVLLQSVRQSNKGPEIIVSRSDKLLLKRLFEMEVPEIYNGSVEIMAIAREAGWRSKVAVWAKQDGVDAVGSCVGLRGIRIQNIVNELHGEKIDVVQWNKDPAAFIASALSPAMVMRVDVDAEAGSAVATVPDRQLSLAIGKEGQNARLAARLTGLKVDIKSDVEAQAEKAAPKLDPADVAALTVDQLGLPTRVLNILTQAGINELSRVLEMSKSELLAIKGFGEKSLTELFGRLREMDLAAPKAQPESPQPTAAEPEEERADVKEVAADVTEVVEVAAEEAVAAAVAEVTEGAAEAGVAEVAEVLATEPVLEPAAAQVEAAEVGTPTEETATVAPEATPIQPLVPEKVPEPVPVPVGEAATSIGELPAHVWTTGGVRPQEPGVIRFAEDIEELRRGGGPRRGRRGGGGQGGQAAGRARRAKVRRKR